MGRVLIYTFYNPRHLTFKVLRSLGGLDNGIDSGQALRLAQGNARMTQMTEEVAVDKYYLGNLNSLTKHILETKPKYILGLGDYRKGSKAIRVETVFVNRYGKRPVAEGGKEKYLATWELEKQDGVIFSETPTFGPCNRSAYYLMKFIEDNSLDTKLAFVHVPSSCSEMEVTKIINSWLRSL